MPDLLLSLDERTQADLQEACRAKGGVPPSRLVTDVLREWLSERLVEIRDEAIVRERLRGLVPCRLLRTVILEGRDGRGSPRRGRWVTGEIAWLEPDVAHRYLDDLEVRILETP